MELHSSLTWIAAIATSLLLAGEASADTVVLKNGNRFEGRVVSENDRQIVLETGSGEVVLKRADIQEVIQAPWTPPARVEKKPEAGKTAKSGADARKAAPKPAPKKTAPPATRDAKRDRTPPARKKAGEDCPPDPAAGAAKKKG